MLRGQLGELVLHDPRCAELFGVPAREGGDNRHQLGRGSFGTLPCGVYNLQGQHVAAQAELEEQVLLAGEMDVDASGAQVCTSSDVARARRMEAFVSKGIHRSVHEALG